MSEAYSDCSNEYELSKGGGIRMRIRVKKFLCLTMLLALSMGLCGCLHVTQTYTMGPDSMTITETLGYNKAKIDALGANEDITKLTVQTIDGVDYYMEEPKTETHTYAQIKEKYVSYAVNATSFYYYDSINGNMASSYETKAQDNSDSASVVYDYVGMSVTFSQPITVTNGTLSEDGLSASWAYKGNDLDNLKKIEQYAYTAENTLETDRANVKQAVKEHSDKKPPKVKGIKNKKTYYKKSLTFYVKDNISIKTIKLNGKKVKGKLMKKGTYKGFYKVTAKKSGVNKLIVTDQNGNQTNYTFTLKKKK